jgi:hypothetical protein
VQITTSIDAETVFENVCVGIKSNVSGFPLSSPFFYAGSGEENGDFDLIEIKVFLNQLRPSRLK